MVGDLDQIGLDFVVAKYKIIRLVGVGFIPQNRLITRCGVCVFVCLFVLWFVYLLLFFY